MIGNKKNRGLDEHLDRVGRKVIRASAANEAEAEASASSPFLYTRVRSRINAARAEREAGESWFTMLGVAWRAIPAMALVAIFAVALFLSANFGTQPSVGTGEDVFLATSDAEVENVVFTDSRALSNDDVLATILNGDDQEASR